MSRIVGAAVLLFIAPFTTLFYVFYTLCGLSDTIDGVIARVTKRTTELGARLDSIADILFYSVMISKIFSVMCDVLPIFVWCFGFLSLAIRGASYITAAIKYKKFASVHTYMNKLTSLTIFIVPYFAGNDTAFIIVCMLVCLFANVSSVEELLMHIIGEYNPERKTLMKVKDEKFKKFVR